MTAPDLPARRLVGRATRALRTEQWWAHMLGPIVAFAYLQVGWRDVGPGDALVRVLALLSSAVALAAYGYVVNDAADVEADRLVGKRNSMARFPVPARMGIVVGFALVGAVPWVVVRLEAPAFVALGALYLLPLLYSPPPLRLKEHPVLGPVLDASNAFIVPALFTIALFVPLGPAAGPAPLMVAGAVAWAFGFGMRAIVSHQVVDAANDRVSGTTTLVTTVGEERAVGLMRRVLFPIELLGLVLLCATVATWAWWLVAAGLVVVGAFHAARLTGLVDRRLAVTTVEEGWFLYWTQVWPALLVSVALAVRDPGHLALTALVVVVFWRRLRSGLTQLVGLASNELRARSRR